MSSIPRISRSFLVHFSSQSDFINAANHASQLDAGKYVSLHAKRAVVSAKPSGEATVRTWAGAPAWRARPSSWSVRPPVHARSAVRRRNQTLARDSGTRLSKSGVPKCRNNSSPFQGRREEKVRRRRFLPFLRSFCSCSVWIHLR